MFSLDLAWRYFPGRPIHAELRTVIFWKSRPDLPPQIANTVITQDREGQNIDGEFLGLALDAVFQPRTAVLGDIATEERLPQTTTDQ